MRSNSIRSIDILRDECNDLWSQFKFKTTNICTKTEKFFYSPLENKYNVLIFQGQWRNDEFFEREDGYPVNCIIKPKIFSENKLFARIAASLSEYHNNADQYLTWICNKYQVINVYV